jgi:transposase
MLLDAFNQALSFYQGVPNRVLIDNPKTMVIKIGKGKERDFHPRFLALMNHYLIEPVACTPTSGW